MSLIVLRRLNWRDLGLILRTVGYHSTLGPVHLQAQLLVLYLQMRKIWLSHTLVVGVEEMEMSMTCLMVLLVVLGTCFLRKHVFDTHEEVRCRDFHRGPFSGRRPDKICLARWIGHRRWRIPRRSQKMESWLFTSLPVTRGQKQFFCHLADIQQVAECIRYIWRAHSW